MQPRRFGGSSRLGTLEALAASSTSESLSIFEASEQNLGNSAILCYNAEYIICNIELRKVI